MNILAIHLHIVNKEITMEYYSLLQFLFISCWLYYISFFISIQERKKTLSAFQYSKESIPNVHIYIHSGNRKRKQLNILDYHFSIFH